jgi:hypothetical protein
MHIPDFSCSDCQFISDDCEGESCSLLNPMDNFPRNCIIKKRNKVKKNCPIMFAAFYGYVHHFEEEK